MTVLGQLTHQRNSLTLQLLGLNGTYTLIKLWKLSLIVLIKINLSEHILSNLINGLTHICSINLSVAFWKYWTKTFCWYPDIITAWNPFDNRCLALQYLFKRDYKLDFTKIVIYQNLCYPDIRGWNQFIAMKYLDIPSKSRIHEEPSQQNEGRCILTRSILIGHSCCLDPCSSVSKGGGAWPPMDPNLAWRNGNAWKQFNILYILLFWITFWNFLLYNIS